MSAVNLANVNIIDADGHVIDRDANLRKFIPEPYCRRQGSLLPNDVWDASMYGKLITKSPDVPTRLRLDSLGAQNERDDRHADAERQGA